MKRKYSQRATKQGLSPTTPRSLLLICFFLTVFVEGQPRHFVRNSDLSNVLFTENVTIHQAEVRSKVHCLIRCFSGSSQCVAFTFSKLSSECRCYSVIPRMTTVAMAAEGAMTYAASTTGETSTTSSTTAAATSTTAITSTTTATTSTTAAATSTTTAATSITAATTSTTAATTSTTTAITSTTTATTSSTTSLKVTTAATWLNVSCSNNSACPAANSECFEGRCLCTPGFFYSQSAALCLTACSRWSAGLMLHYPLAYFYAGGSGGPYTLLGQSAVTHAACVSNCLAVPTCYSVYWFQGSSYCYNYNTTVQNPAFLFKYNYGTDYNHHSRACA